MNKHYLKVVECAIEHDQKFLVIKRPEGKHAGGLLSFPGGKVEEIDEHEGDVLKAAARREIWEEVGLDLKDDLAYVTSSYFVDSHGTHVIDTLFHCKIDKTDLKISASAREVPAYYWLSESEIHQATNAPDWLKKYVSCIRRAG